jgi:DNA-binding MarR family transcriptional regulator
LQTPQQLTISDTPLLAQLVKAMNWVHHSMQNEIEGSGFGPYNISQAIVLCNIILGINRPSGIAREMGLSRQAVSLILKELEAEGVIELADDPHHKLAKVARIKIDDRTHGLQAVTGSAVAAVDDRLRAQIGKKKLEGMKAALDVNWGPVTG